ncbi:N-acyl-D-amino-acid deacylase family protein [Leucobacter iarius]|uniref:Amidohydrolase family protein n=1 Tax=Leucobacter iarius TaxID=333963 RepID=A0ABN2L6M2_9MICO
MPANPSPELVIRGASIPRPHRRELDRGAVVIAEGRIAAVLPDDVGIDPAVPRIDAAGRVVLPGLIDAHSHAEAALGEPEAELAMLRQGVTSAVIGQDGVSFAPASGSAAHELSRYFAAINGPVPAALAAGTDLATARRELTAPARVNAALLVPCGNLRASRAGFGSAPLTDDELASVERDARLALDQGAVGLSLGLEYVPGGFADQRELLAYARIAAEHGVPLVAHIRGYEERSPEGLAEFIGLARGTGASLHVSHLHGPAELILPRIDAAIASGVDLTFDSYPYRRGNTILAMLALPAELQRGGPTATLEALADPGLLDRLEREWFPDAAELLSRVTISFAPHPDWTWIEGRLLNEAALETGRSAGALVCELLRATELATGAIVQQPEANRVSDLRAIAGHAAHLGSSDGVYLGSRPHPRGWGSFARMLRRHVLEWGDWSWWDAAEHLSGRAARRFGLAGRGSLTAGSVADLALIDPGSLYDRADYDNPRVPADGVLDVLVAGVPTLSAGRLTEYLGGRGIPDHARSSA